MSAGTSWRLAALLAIWALVMEVVSLVIMAMNGSTVGLRELGFNGVGGIVLGATYPVVGWILASRRPENPIGWIFLVIGVSQAGTAMLEQYAVYGLETRPGTVPLADIASWVGAWSWVPGFVLLLVMILVFPDGSLPSRRWRPVLWLAAIAGVMVLVPNAIASWGYRGVELLGSSEPDTSNAPVIGALILVSAVGNVLLIPVAVASLAGLAVRFRRSSVVERQQIKWFAAAAAVEVSLLVSTAFVSLTYPLDVLAAFVVIPLVPIAVGVAVLRYRLYEIDRLISRTIGWAIVTGLLVAVFAGLVVALQALLAPVTNENTLAVAASTLVAFALFQPLRRRVQRAVDRRFDRARYDGQQTVDAFAERLRNEVDLASLLGDLSGTTGSAVTPVSIAIWIRATVPAR